MMTRDDERELRELAASVYVTPRQRVALMNALAQKPACEHWGEMTIDRAPGEEHRSDCFDEDRRHALLGPCGAE